MNKYWVMWGLVHPNGSEKFIGPMKVDAKNPEDAVELCLIGVMFGFGINQKPKEVQDSFRAHCVVQVWEAAPTHTHLGTNVSSIGGGHYSNKVL